MISPFGCTIGEVSLDTTFHIGDFHEKAVMSKKLAHCFLVGRSNVGKAGVDLASIRTRSPERFTIGSDVLAGGA